MFVEFLMRTVFDVKQVLPLSEKNPRFLDPTVPLLRGLVVSLICEVPMDLVKMVKMSEMGELGYSKAPRHF